MPKFLRKLVAAARSFRAVYNFRLAYDGQGHFNAMQAAWQVTKVRHFNG